MEQTNVPLRVYKVGKPGNKNSCTPIYCTAAAWKQVPPLLINTFDVKKVFSGDEGLSALSFTVSDEMLPVSMLSISSAQ